MTPSEIEMAIRKHDLQLSAIAQILPTLATKEDLKIYATKEDLKIYATKDDLLAVKKELQEAIQEVDRHAKVMYESVKSDTQIIAEYVATITRKKDDA